MSSAIKSRRGKADRYLELVREFPLRPLRDAAEYRRATTVLDRFAVQPEGSLPADEQDYMDTLTLLVEQYDRQCRANETPIEPVKILRHLMMENGMNVTALGEVLGSVSVASEVLSGKRALSKANMAKLANRFAVDVSLFFPLPAYLSGQ